MSTVSDSIADDDSVNTVPTTNLNPSLLKLKLLDCLRNSDTTKLNELINQCKSIPPTNHQIHNLLNQLLHFSVQVGPLSIIEYIVSQKLIQDINSQDDDGNTALHLACISSRNDVIFYLMSLPDINDCILNKQLKQPLECCSNMDTAQFMSDIRTKYVEIKANELRNAFETRNFNKLELLLSQPRIRTLLDINGTDPITGDTVLLEFIKKDDLEMVQFILKFGGDPFKRNLNGKLPIDSVTSSSMRKLIKESCNDQTMIDSTNQSGQPQVGPPTFKGFLKKWTNFASGYKLRWFILDNEGRLSYYKSPNDIFNSCRGMIHLSNAQLRMDSSEKSKFEIIIKKQDGTTPLKWHLKANHVIETNRWVWALQNAIRYAKDIEKQQQQQQQQQQLSHRPINDDNTTNKLKTSTTARNRESFDSNRASNTFNINTKLNNDPSTAPLSPNILQAHQRSFSQASSISLSSDDEAPTQSSINSGNSTSSKTSYYRRPINKLTKKLGRKKRESFGMPEIKENAGLKLSSNKSSMNSTTSLTSLESSSQQQQQQQQQQIGMSSSLDDDMKSSDEEDDIDEVDYNDTSPSQNRNDSFNDVGGEEYEENSDLTVCKNQMKIELNSFKEFLKTVENDSQITKSELIDVCLTILKNLESLSSKQSELISNKETKFKKYVDRQLEISRIWENSIKQLGLEIQDRESRIVELEDKLRIIKKTLKNNIELVNPMISKSLSDTATLPPTIKPATALETSTKNLKEVKEENESVVEPKSEILKFLEEEDESDDEFFDAENDESELGSLPTKNNSNVNVANTNTNTTTTNDNDTTEISEPTAKESNEPPITQTIPTITTTTSEEVEEEEEEQKKEETTVDNTQSPPVVNGFVLKSPKQLIIYDKIDKEKTFKGYEDPIRTTLTEEDNRPKISLWGVLKSLVGKDMTKMTLPVTFNEPTSLLQRNAEVIEYSDLLDKAATIDESTLRMVYVAGFAASEYVSTVGRIAKPFNPLLGETFEYARPDKGYRVFLEQVSHHPPISALKAEAPSWSYYGMSHVKTKFLGRSFDIKHLGTWFCELYPDNGLINSKGKKLDSELYSWKKVNNSVIGIIVGNPQIDNYGEMEIRNHMTGDYMSFTFKQRGWRASSACEVKGEVYSNDGQLKYTVGGHWNSKIYAKPVNSEKAFIIFEANPKTEMMFHLTNFAASLNAPQPHLLPILPPTDTRLRPDQRAMENGEYDLAASEKNRVEEKQRLAKRERDAKNEIYEPCFFKLDKHPVTGDEYYNYKDNYWSLRRDGKLKDYKDIY
ncbi:hypothetical protein CANARDRAFT_17296 [[Candida] arabinofermentans NRRL YB-2248]|uniref:PH domain-containing protein n=1 Tax=[Candida] arabinofermentans NRRL YB-2248 TaxID=983967 RepID=A0A1E4T2S7_9ASCO|nr:hypothetical protein CANARDRAFT_17296 [[Candida] arabinofermentans NRRL YB-2248]